MGYLSYAEETILRKYAEKVKEKKEAPGAICQEGKEVYVLRGGHPVLRGDEIYYDGGLRPCYLDGCCLPCFLRGEIHRLDAKPNKVYINCSKVLYDYFDHNREFSEEYPLEGLTAQEVKKASMLLKVLRAGRLPGIVEQIMKSVE